MYMDLGSFPVQGGGGMYMDLGSFPVQGGARGVLIG